MVFRRIAHDASDIPWDAAWDMLWTMYGTQGISHSDPHGILQAFQGATRR